MECRFFQSIKFWGRFYAFKKKYFFSFLGKYFFWNFQNFWKFQIYQEGGLVKKKLTSSWKNEKPFVVCEGKFVKMKNRWLFFQTQLCTLHQIVHTSLGDRFQEKLGGQKFQNFFYINKILGGILKKKVRQKIRGRSSRRNSFPFNE